MYYSTAGQGFRSAAMVSTKSTEGELLKLMNETGYNIVQENGQRKYGPPPDWNGPPPAKGSEVFVGKIPRDLYEDELVPVFGKIGKIYEIRLMMDFSGSNRGYAFVMYTNPMDAKRAIQELDNFEIRKGRFIGVCKSVDNCRLFVGGIPKTKTREEIFNEMKKITDGVVDVILYSSVTDKTKNRGFAFVEYENHRAAAMARRKLIPGKIQLWGHEIAVDWAEPEPEVDEETMSKVTVLYVRNFMLSTTEDQIKDKFSLGNQLRVEKVKKLRDFAFVHYATREDAEAALNEFLNSEITLDGAQLEVTWAKPAERAGRPQRTRLGGMNVGGQVMATCAVTTAWPNAAQPHSIVPAYASQLYGPIGTTPGGPPMVRVRAGRGAAGLRRPRGGIAANNFMMRGAAGFPRPVEHRFFELQPGMELLPTNPYTLKPYRPPPQILNEICQKNNWGEPQYLLHSTHQTGDNGQTMQLFLCKVTIPNLHSGNNNNLYNNFQPNKLCTTAEEAKKYAAEYVLSQLGITPEGLEANAAIPPHTQLMVAAAPGGGAPGLSLPPPSQGQLGPHAGYAVPLAAYDHGSYYPADHIPAPPTISY